MMPWPWLDNGPAQGLTWASPGFGPGQPRPAQVNFLVQILVKQNNSSNSIHCNNKGGRARSARPPLLFPFPLLLLLFCLTKILTKKLTWAGLGWPGSSPGLAQQALGWALVKSWENWPICHFFRQVASKRCIFIKTADFFGPAFFLLFDLLTKN